MVKGWRDSEGELHEKVYDIAWSETAYSDPITMGSFRPSATPWIFRMPAGPTPLAMSSCQPSGRIRIFDNRDEQAFYYVRVLEIPTPRWTCYDAKRFNVKMGPRGTDDNPGESLHVADLVYPLQNSLKKIELMYTCMAL